MRTAGVLALGLLLSPAVFSQASNSTGSAALQEHPRQIPLQQMPLWTPGKSAPQTPSPAQTPQPSYANYSIMLVSPAGGGAVVLMHNPKNELEFVEVNHTQQALSAGYVPVRAAELAEFMTALKDENAKLQAENLRLRSGEAKQASGEPCSTLPPGDDSARERCLENYRKYAPNLLSPQPNPAPVPAPSAAELSAQRNAQLAAEEEARRRQLIQTWLLLQNMNRQQPYQIPMPVNPNAGRMQTNCTTTHIGDTAYTNCN